MGSKIDTEIIWFDENIKNEENTSYFKKLQDNFNYFNGYQSLDKGFKKFYNLKFSTIFVIVSGRLFGRYIRKIKENIHKIINLPYTYIFTSSNFKKALLRQIHDNEHIISYDTMINANDGFYNPGGIYDDFDELLDDIKMTIKKIDSNNKIYSKINEKINYEGLLTFEYLESEEDLLAPALYKDIITNKKITREDCKSLYNYILSYNDDDLNKLVKNLYLFKYVPYEILCKYWARLYSIESDFYKILNNHLMKSRLSYNYKTFIKMFYTGVEINSLKSYTGRCLYRGAVINRNELEKIKKYIQIGKISNIVVFAKAFLSFSEVRGKAEEFCGKSDSTKVKCLYILENKNIHLHESNANIQKYSVLPEEKEILFFPGSSFIIKKLEEINKNFIEITLNYNGKFKEKFSFIYEDNNKINNLISNNILTKNISGEKLVFLKGGKYLIEKTIGKSDIGAAFIGKDLETDEFVIIKQIEKINSFITKEVNSLKKIAKTIKYTVKFKDYFENEKYYFVVLEYYEDYLTNFINHKKLSPNLIKKIIAQVNITFKELLNNHIIHRDIKPDNIIIKYLNEEKTNFDCFLTGFDISDEFNEDNIHYEMIGTPLFMAPEICKGNGYRSNCDLFSIGVLIYYLYFNSYPFYNKSAINLKVNTNFQIEEDKQLEDLLKKLLKEDPDERISWKEYFEHPFFKQYEY